ncbi:SlyX family protein [Billgrantia diversa]|uniref:SlyX family protein n=1 Tax=Halomonas sp. MCCC 1A13316 TaxID=2733487 RepID=UPI0018D4CD61
MTTRHDAPSTNEGATMNSDTQRDDSNMSLSQALASRLEALESRIAYQEHWLDTLDEAVASQERRLAQLERINSLMQEKLRDQQRALQDSEMAAPSPQDEVPPHY